MSFRHELDTSIRAQRQQRALRREQAEKLLPELKRVREEEAAEKRRADLTWASALAKMGQLSLEASRYLIENGCPPERSVYTVTGYRKSGRYSLSKFLAGPPILSWIIDSKALTYSEEGKEYESIHGTALGKDGCLYRFFKGASNGKAGTTGCLVKEKSKLYTFGPVEDTSRDAERQLYSGRPVEGIPHPRDKVTAMLGCFSFEGEIESYVDRLEPQNTEQALEAWKGVISNFVVGRCA
jgi:hypothetical protein